MCDKTDCKDIRSEQQLHCVTVHSMMSMLVLPFVKHLPAVLSSKISVETVRDLPMISTEKRP